MNDRLFEMLAQARSQPSKALRAVQSAGQAGQDIIGGYMGGKEIGQQLRQYKILNTPLGELFQDPSQIPFGLGPQHTVNDLRMVASSLENYAPANLISGIASQYGGNVAPAGSSRPPTQAPAPTIASTSMAPIPGAENPAPPSGTSALQDIQGAGQGNEANLPPGTSPTLNVPAGGMGMGAVQKLLIPALNAAREGRQFHEGQRQTADIARLGREQSHQQFLEDQAAQEARFRRGKVVEAASGQKEAVSNLGTIDTAVAGLKDALTKNVPSPMSNIQANIAETAGTPTPYGISLGSGSAQKVNEAAATTRAALATEITRTGRYTPFVDQILNAMVPTAKDQNWQEKIGLINRFRAAVASGSQQNIDNAISAATGGTVHIPSAPNPSGIHQTAIQWARANPNNPKAKAVLAKALALSGGQ